MGAKRYYWIKLKEDFFQDDVISWIEEQEKGVYYSNFYLKLCLKAMNTEGILIRNVGDMLIPYDAKQLSKITGVEIDTVIVAMEIFKKVGLVEILENGEIYLSQLKGMIGSESKWAEKKRLQRQKRDNVPRIEDNVPKLSGQCPTDIDIDKEIDKDKDIYINLDKKNKKEYIDLSSKGIEDIEYVNITLIEYDKLMKQYDNKKVKDKIYALDDYIANNPKGKKYKDHYRVLRSWLNKETDTTSYKNEKNKTGRVIELDIG